MGSLDTSQFDQEFTSMPPSISPNVREAYFGSLDRAFEGFTFIDDSAQQLMLKRGAAKPAAKGGQGAQPASQQQNRRR